MSKQTATTEAEFKSIPLSKLVLNNFNPRKLEENQTPQRMERFKELVVSVREKGIIEPLVVRSIAKGKFEVIAGERRYRAAMAITESKDIKNTLKTFIPCMIRQADDDEAFDIMTIENLQREDLAPIEAAQGFKAYLNKHGDSAEALADLAARIGLPGHAIRRQVRLMELPEQILTVWQDGTLSHSHVEMFTRINDNAQALQVLTVCLQKRFTVKELRNHIASQSVPLDRGFFDKADCQTCPSNSSLQSGLFPDMAETSGCCENPPCFEQKQGDFIDANWKKGKAAKEFKTKGFRFEHKVDNEKLEVVTAEKPTPRCLKCGDFVSVIRITGAVVAGKERVCVGERKCFEEQYAQPVQKTEPEQSTASPKSTKETPTPTPSATAKTAQVKDTTPNDTGPVNNTHRGREFREAFYQEKLADSLVKPAASGPLSLRLAVIALALASREARSSFCEVLKIKDTFDNARGSELVEQVMLFDEDELRELLQAMSSAHIMKTAAPHIRHTIAPHVGIEIEKQWSINEKYIDALTKSEVIRVGEEKQVALWDDKKIMDEHEKRYRSKALMSLKKDQMKTLIFKSGADLVGRVPNEVIGK